MSHPIHAIRISSESFDNLKDDFDEAINSKRRLKRTQTVADLIDVLWKRDEIGCHNIEALFQRSFRIFSEDERAIIRNYVAQFDSDPYPVSQFSEESANGESAATEAIGESALLLVCIYY